MPRKKKTTEPDKPELPQYVVLKFDPPEWHVRRNFPTGERNEKGRTIYLQPTRRCYPETPERAKEISDELEREYNAATAEPTIPETVGSFLAYYLEKKRYTVERRTYEHDLDLYERYFKGRSFASKALPDLRPHQIQTYFDGLKDSGVSPAMLEKVRIFFAGGINQAIKWELITETPIDGLLLPRHKKKTSPAFTKLQARAFRKVCSANDDFLCLDFDLATGLRPQELLALTWPNLDLDRCRARVREAVAVGFRGGGFEVKGPKTESSHRTVPFGEDLRDRLIAHKKKQEAFLLELRRSISRPALLDHMKRKGTNYDKRLDRKRREREILENFKTYNLVFPSANGKPQSRENLNRREMKDALTAAKIDPTRFSLQSLRRTFGTLMAEKVSPKRLQQLMGHARIETTMEFYVYLDDEDLDAIPDKFEEALK